MEIIQDVHCILHCILYIEPANTNNNITICSSEQFDCLLHATDDVIHVRLIGFQLHI